MDTCLIEKLIEDDDEESESETWNGQEMKQFMRERMQMYEINLADVAQTGMTAMSILQDYISSNESSFRQYYIFAEVVAMRDIGEQLKKFDCLGSQSSEYNYAYLLVISRRDLAKLSRKYQVQELTDMEGMQRAENEWPESYRLFII